MEVDFLSYMAKIVWALVLLWVLIHVHDMLGKIDNKLDKIVWIQEKKNGRRLDQSLNNSFGKCRFVSRTLRFV